MEYIFNIGERVIYDGLIAIIEDVGIDTNGNATYNLIAEKDDELTCTAKECNIEKYQNQDIDQDVTLEDAYFYSNAIANLGNNLTDKNFRDRNH